MGAVEEIIALARSVSGGSDPSAALEQIDAAITESTSPLDIGRLQMARSLALQCSPDPNDAADAMLEAVHRVANDALRDGRSDAANGRGAHGGSCRRGRTGTTIGD